MTTSKLFTYWTRRLFTPDSLLRDVYGSFKELLRHDGQAHVLMADLADLFHQERYEEFNRVLGRYQRFAAEVGGMVACLDRMAPGAHPRVSAYFRKFDFYVRFLLAPPEIDLEAPFVVGLDTGSGADQVGNKSANLMALGRMGLSIPQGFALTVSAFHQLIEHNRLRCPVNALLAEIDLDDKEGLACISRRLSDLVLAAEIPPLVAAAMEETLEAMAVQDGPDLRYAVRSSAVGEDDAESFAGQYRSVLDVTRAGLAAAYLRVVASKYSPEALFYRIRHGLHDEETAMAVLILEMVEPRAAGVVYTVDPTGEDGNTLLVQAVPGRGEALVSGIAEAEVFRFARQGTGPPRLAAAPDEASLTRKQAEELAGLALRIEAGFGPPQDIEWALDQAGRPVLLQSRPLRTPEARPAEVRRPVTSDHPVLLRGGITAAKGVAAGPVYRVDRDHPLEALPAGAVLVSREIPPEYARVMDRLAAVVAESGSRACHLATVCREFGVPLLVGCGPAARLLQHGRSVTVAADQTLVFEGRVQALLAPSGTRRSRTNGPYFQRLRAMLDFVTPLNLRDPAAPEFKDSACRSMHDIVRFSHETAIRSMFGLGDRLVSRVRGTRRLESSLPLQIFLVDVGGGFAPNHDGKAIPVEGLRSVPLLALLNGLLHPSVNWEGRSHFDWKTFDELTMAGGITSPNSVDLASYGVVGRDYLNFNIRFGYHFTIVDTLCSANRAENYCSIRFAGGGADFEGRALRLRFVSGVLERLGFRIAVKGDLLNARVGALPREELTERLDLLGRLLGATKLLDMSLKDKATVERYIDDFFDGRSHFLVPYS